MPSPRRWILFSGSFILCIALAIAISQPNTQGFIENSGINIPTTDVVRDYAYGACWGCALLVSILLWPVDWNHKKLLAAGWLVKCLVALVLMLPYERQYWGLDCWTYFQRAHAGVGGLLAGIANNGSNIVIGLGVLHLQIGPDSYHAMKLSFAMVGFIGVYLFYRAAEILLGRSSPFAFWALLLYPSVLFWSSIMGKDPLILAAIGLNVWGVASLSVKRKKIYVFAILGGIGAASVVRIWMGPILLIPCLLLAGTHIRHAGWKIAALLPIAIGLLFLIPLTFDRLRFDRAADLVEAARTVTAGWDRANSTLRLDSEIQSTWDLLLFTPQSMFIAYFRPLPGDIPNMFGWLAGFENLGLLALSAWAFLRIRLRHFHSHLFIWALAFLGTWGIAYSVIAYKDLGAAVRYKLQIIPILLGVIGYLCHESSRVQRAEKARAVADRSRHAELTLS
jgi:hypothetical protein